MSVIDLIAEERRRQQDEEGFSLAHDDEHVGGELATAAACYAIPNYHQARAGMHDTLAPPAIWPWKGDAWRPTPGDRKRELVIAAALLVAELERLDRAEARTGEAAAV